MINTQIKESIAWIQLNRPEQKNALSIELLIQLQDTLQKIDADSNIRVIILMGEQNFSSGGDINDMQVDSEESAKQIAEKVQGIYSSIAAISKPVIAYTKGLVYGGGMELALVCDIIISHSNAKFALPEAAIGIIPGGGATQRLKPIIGKQNAAYMLFTGNPFSAKKMLDLNLIQEIEDNISSVESIATSIAQKNPIAIKALKHLLNKDMDFKAESESFTKLLQADGKKGIQSFINEKKLPSW